MMYKGFANVYDHMMENIPYEEWFSKLKLYLKTWFGGRAYLRAGMWNRNYDGEVC